METINDITAVLLLILLNALIVTDWDDISDCKGIPDIRPFIWLMDRPIGRDPEVMEKDTASPLTIGAIVNDLSIGRAQVDWG